MISSDTKKGVKVLCIDGEFQDDPELPFLMKEIKLPQEGVMYTVRNIKEGVKGGYGVRLKEIRNKRFHFDIGGLKEPVFSLKRFELIK